MYNGIHDSCWLSACRSSLKAGKQNTHFSQAFCETRNAASPTRTKAKNGCDSPRQSGLPHFLLFSEPQHGPDPPRVSGGNRHTSFLSLSVKLFIVHKNITVVNQLKLLVGMETKQEKNLKPNPQSVRCGVSLNDSENKDSVYCFPQRYDLSLECFH